MQYCFPPLDESWADCLSARGFADFSRMQPDQPNPYLIVAMIFGKMVSTAGVKEAELQGSSSVMRRNVVADPDDVIQGET